MSDWIKSRNSRLVLVFASMLLGGHVGLVMMVSLLHLGYLGLAVTTGVLLCGYLILWVRFVGGAAKVCLECGWSSSDHLVTFCARCGCDVVPHDLGVDDSGL